MKKLSSLKLKDLVPTRLDVSELGNLVGGVDGDIMLRAYGCESEVCKNNQPGSEEKCTTDTCYTFTCKSGA
ncbi:TIGR04149 family rSAM-modified RiPP [Parabacteroides sp. W1-Q-101]|uniref:TIGR04149 family rSAM-modified RiPP n=1 Tax=Parabacteroides caeci TaxID=2949650 RepID=UPI00202F177C|nr:TIGR04149 family rSAM-modified RiPP [Parabacteroides sp. W1-Q-101]MCM0717989.1 TIGR04149 family rSAM-modified RiPP [Parabacteroides sp. W1-Q-101]